jgi:serine protease Do
MTRSSNSSASLTRLSRKAATKTAAAPPEALAGIQQGDVIVKVNGQPVTQDQTVSYLVANQKVGSRVPIEIVRNYKHATVYVTLADRPTEDALNKIAGGDSGTSSKGSVNAPSAQKVLGLSLSPLTPEVARGANLPATARGVIVTSVDPNSDAGDTGFRPGDLIMSVNNQPVTSPAQVMAAVDTARKAGRTSVLLLVKRGNTPEQFVALSIK